MKRTLKRLQSEYLTSDQLMYLISGPDIISWGSGGPPFKSEAAALAAFEKHHDQIMRRQVETGGEDLFTHFYPECRPWCWFRARGLRFPLIQDQPAIIEKYFVDTGT